MNIIYIYIFDKCLSCHVVNNDLMLGNGGVGGDNALD